VPLPSLFARRRRSGDRSGVLAGTIACHRRIGRARCEFRCGHRATRSFVLFRAAAKAGRRIVELPYESRI